MTDPASSETVPTTRPSALAAWLTSIGIAHARSVTATVLLLVGVLLLKFGSLEKEVGFFSYSGPHDEYVERISSHMEEFQTGRAPASV